MPRPNPSSEVTPILNIGGCPLTIRDVYRIVHLLCTEGSVLVEGCGISGPDHAMLILGWMANRLSDEDKAWLREAIKLEVKAAMRPGISVVT